MWRAVLWARDVCERTDSGAQWTARPTLLAAPPRRWGEESDDSPANTVPPPQDYVRELTTKIVSQVRHKNCTGFVDCSSGIWPILGVSAVWFCVSTPRNPGRCIPIVTPLDSRFHILHKSIRLKPNLSQVEVELDPPGLPNQLKKVGRAAHCPPKVFGRMDSGAQSRPAS